MNYSNDKINKIKMACSLFLQNELYIAEVAEIMEMSRSSIQRYLNDPIIPEILNAKEQEIIKNKLSNNYHKGKIKGGINYSKNNQYVKKRNGKFNGSIKKKSI